MQRKSLLPFLLIITLGIGFWLGSLYQNQTTPLALFHKVNPIDSHAPENVDFGLFWQAWNTVHTKYVDQSKLNDRDLVFGAIDGMVKSIKDPYTVFFPPKESEGFAQEINGSFGGIGIEVGIRNDALTVVAPIKNSPAEKAGLSAGDKILKIENKPTDGMKIDEAVNLIRGKIGTQVHLTYLHNAKDQPKDITITRDTIRVPAVEWKLIDNHIAHLQVLIFNKNVDAEFQRTAQEILHSKADSIILDLRNNPGGLLDSAIDLAGYFMSPDQIVTTEKSGNGNDMSFKTQGNASLKKYKLIILLNKGSASASEILAGALHDTNATVIVGEKSFGKGSVQEVVDLPQKTSLKVTVAKWFTPKGISINENGIAPDYTVERSVDDIKADKDPQLDKAKSLLITP